MKKLPNSLLYILGVFPLLPGGLLIYVILQSSAKDLAWGASNFFPVVLALFVVLQFALYFRGKAQKEFRRRCDLGGAAEGPESSPSKPL